jgi:hypothetical protein
MKKISTIVLIAGLSSFVFAQKGNVFSKSHANNNQPQTEELGEGTPGDGGLDGGDPSPIDDYIPLLAAAGLGMAVYFGRKKLAMNR